MKTMGQKAGWRGVVFERSKDEREGGRTLGKRGTGIPYFRHKGKIDVWKEGKHFRKQNIGLFT